MKKITPALKIIYLFLKDNGSEKLFFLRNGPFFVKVHLLYIKVYGYFHDENKFQVIFSFICE